MTESANPKRGLWTYVVAPGMLALVGLGCGPAVNENASPGLKASPDQSPQHAPPPVTRGMEDRPERGQPPSLPPVGIEIEPAGDQPPPPPEGNVQNGPGMNPPPSATDLLTRLDQDGDGKISESEFDGPAEHFSQFDTDGDGYLTESEIPDGPPGGQGPPRGQRRPGGHGGPQGEGGPQGQRPPRGQGPPPGAQQAWQ